MLISIIEYQKHRGMSSGCKGTLSAKAVQPIAVSRHWGISLNERVNIESFTGGLTIVHWSETESKKGTNKFKSNRHDWIISKSQEFDCKTLPFDDRYFIYDTEVCLSFCLFIMHRHRSEPREYWDRGKCTDESNVRESICGSGNGILQTRNGWRSKCGLLTIHFTTDSQESSPSNKVELHISDFSLEGRAVNTFS